MRLLAFPFFCVALALLWWYFRTPIGNWFASNGKFVGFLSAVFLVAFAFAYFLGFLNISFS